MDSSHVGPTDPGSRDGIRGGPGADPGPDSCVIWTQDLGKTYRRGAARKPVPALRGVDLRVRAGEIYGFLGQNGAGKSTTIKLLTGMIRPTAGRALVCGRAAGSVESRADLGYLPENPVFNGAFSVREFLIMSARLHGLCRRDAGREIDRLIGLLDLAALTDRRLGKLSKGQQQLVGIAHALIGSPRLLVLDEPMSGLDPGVRKRVRDLLLDYRARGRTVFLSSHILGDVELLCDRVGLIRDGHFLGSHAVHGIRDSGRGDLELVVTGVSGDEIRGICPDVSEIRTLGERLVVRVPGSSSIEELLSALIARGARIRSLTPGSGRLEAFVLSVIESDADTGRMDDGATGAPDDAGTPAVGGER